MGRLSQRLESACVFCGSSDEADPEFLGAARSVGAVHGGLNLYNNGFAAGIVAAVLVPIILAIRSRNNQEQGT